MINYKQRDKARALYSQGWHESELENKFGCKMTSAWIPQWMKDQRNKREIELEKQRIKALKQSQRMKRYRDKQKKLAERELARKLKKSEVKRVKKMINKIMPENAFSQARHNKQKCIVNKWLMSR